jgi:hypothetical protein
MFISPSLLPQYIEDKYKYSYNRPTIIIDPSGWWGELVHYYTTKNICMYIGIDKSVCEEIAEANNSVDYGNDCPYKNSRPHFPGGLWKSISDAKKAISRCDPNSLGACRGTAPGHNML